MEEEPAAATGGDAPAAGRSIYSLYATQVETRSSRSHVFGEFDIADIFASMIYHEYPFNMVIFQSKLFKYQRLKHLKEVNNNTQTFPCAFSEKR